MKLKLFLLVVLCSSSLLSCKNNRKDAASSESADFANSFSISSEFVDELSQFNVTIHLKDNLHAYAIGEKTGKPVDLKISDLNGWATDGDLKIPAGHKKKIGELGESVVLEGDVTLSQKLKKGSGRGEAQLYLQVCTALACDRPRIHKLPLVVGERKTVINP